MRTFIRVRSFAVRLVLSLTESLKEKPVNTCSVPTRLGSAVCLILAWMALASAECAVAQPEPKHPEPLNPKVIVVTPAAAPVPALKYRLLPSIADLNPGDAAPIYLRLRGFDGNKPLEEAWNQIGEVSLKWKNVPLDQFPTEEARKFVDLWKAQLEQIEFGTRRRACDWNYTLYEQRLDRVNVTLPDIQAMRRQWARLLAIKMRVQIAEGKYHEAIHTLETGLAFARHVADGPFLINALVGISIAQVMLEQYEELITRPGVSNLYWALTTLPRPFICLRDQLEVERNLLQSLIPELTEAGVNPSRTAAEWASLMARMHRRIEQWCQIYTESAKNDPALTALLKWDLNRFKSESLPTAREYLKTVRPMAGPTIAAMTDDQTVALYLAGRVDDLWDDLFKASYLPPRDAIPRLEAATKRIQAAKTVPLTLFLSVIPSIASAMKAQLQLDRHIAALRVIEALRIHAAAHNGILPASLDQITEVPVPTDPATGEPFIYRADDGAAILHGLRVGLPLQPTYSIKIRR
jgi:hypothetical protein